MNQSILNFLFLLFSFSLFGQTEICFNRIDDDGDGKIDCTDQDCYTDDSCWFCATEFYQIHSNSALVALDPVSGTYYNLATISGVDQINGAQFNHIDGHVYAPCVINGQHTLGMLKSNGEVIDLGLNLPGNGIFYVGGIDPAGKLYLSNGSQGINYIDLNQQTLSIVSTGVGHPGIADFSVDNTNGLFYGISGANKLVVYDPYSGAVTNYPLAGSINGESGGYGAAWSCVDGSFFAYNNSSGKIYTVNTQNLTATEVLNATGNLSINDGFNCLNAPPPFESNCGDGIDNDGDGYIDCADGDCLNSNECMIEICNNGIDDDNDGWIDCSDTECFYLSYCVEDCSNGIDDNNNGLVDGADPQCGSSQGGVNGGLESNGRLAQKLATRYFNQKTSPSKSFEEKLEGVFPFSTEEQRNAIAVANFIPQVWNDTYVAESTPEDLIQITNAIDLAAADYYQENIRIATVLAIESENGVYEHSKYICDRLDGSTLLDASLLYANGGYFTSYELRNKFGQKEYALSFSIRNNNEQWQVESHWNLHKYTANADFYNFQIWADNYAHLIELLELTLEKVEDLLPIENYYHSPVPTVFISQGKYENGKLQLQIRNKLKATELNFSAGLTKVENGTLEEIEMPITLSGAPIEQIEIEIGNLYDIGISLEANSSTADNIFLADGTWAVDTNNPNTQIESFEISEHSGALENNSLSLERSIALTAVVKDYLNIYRTLNAKLNPVDLNEFNSFEFDASGDGLMEVTLVKNSIEDWNLQPRITVELNQEKKNHSIGFGDLQWSTEESLEDVHSIVFSLIGDNQSFETKTIQLENLRFTTKLISSTIEGNRNQSVAIFPNPVNDIAYVQYHLENAEKLNLRISDMLGKSRISINLDSSKGYNRHQINLSDLENGQYSYQVFSNEKLISSDILIVINN